MWFNKDHLTKFDPIFQNSIRGYVLPHAGTAHTGHIMSHTLRFRPEFINFDRVLILYYPVHNSPNVTLKNGDKYYHEYYVPYKTLEHVIKKFWGVTKSITFEGINITNQSVNKGAKLNNTLVIISADFSHHLPLEDALQLENKAAHGLLHKDYSNADSIEVVDNIKTFNFFNQYKMDYKLEWIGRTRSSGKKGVGYLSFLIKLKDEVIEPVDGYFVTVYDKEMTTRECLGKWFNQSQEPDKEELNAFIKNTIKLAGTTSRLTKGQKLNVPIKHYTITYLYEDTDNEYIRGYHGIKYSNAFYLPDVMLENTFNNGESIEPRHTEWPSDNEFNLKYIKNKLVDKSKKHGSKRSYLTEKRLYSSKSEYYTLN
tara:strand:+ start:9068 stop:10174 length:1107 start_codon:yes stop_codon:yes gene_type:complete